MIIIGIHGAIGHGKSTLAAALLKVEPTGIHLESFHLVAEVARAWQATLEEIPEAADAAAINHWMERLPAILATKLQIESPTAAKIDNQSKDQPAFTKLFTHLALLRAHPELLDQDINDETKAQFRPFLQWIGGYVSKQVDDQAWYRQLIRQARLAEAKGATMAVIGGLRLPGDGQMVHEHDGIVLEVRRPGAPLPDQDDATESERRQLSTDASVINDGTIEQLTAVAGQILKDIRTNNLQTTYQASRL